MTLVELLPFVLVAVAFWLLILRPAKIRRNEQAALLARLATGQRVMTTAGVFGTIASVDTESIGLEVAPGVVIEMVPQAIARVVAEAATPATDAGATSDARDPGLPTDGSDDHSVEADRG